MSDSEGPSAGRLFYVFIVLLLVAFGTIWGMIKHIFMCDGTDCPGMVDCDYSTAMARRFVNK